MCYSKLWKKQDVFCQTNILILNNTYCPTNNTTMSDNTTFKKSPDGLEEETEESGVVHQILNEAGLLYEPGAVERLLEYITHYIDIIINCAVCYMNHANRKQLSVDDIKLAIETFEVKCNAFKMSRKELLEMAKSYNKCTKFPEKIPTFRLTTPAKGYALTEPNYGLMKPYSVQRSPFADASNRLNQINQMAFRGNPFIRTPMPLNVPQRILFKPNRLMSNQEMENKMQKFERNNSC